MTVTPVNFRKQDSSPEALARDVDYALQIVDFYVSKLPGGAARLLGRKVLELGPGYALGTAVLLACHGAQVSVADRYLAPWDDEYHRPFLEALLARLAADRPHLDPEPIRQLLAAGAWEPSIVNGMPLGTEDLHEVPDDAFDVVLSNAVFEHVGDVPRALQTLVRITRAGGHGIHQVDFRDHRDFSRPLEYFTLSQEAFNELFAEVHGECGNRWRPGAMQLEAEAAGFEVLEFDANMHADDAYLDDLMPRLDTSAMGLDREALRPISGCFVLRNRVSVNTEYPVENDSPQTLAHSKSRYAFAGQFAAGKRVLDIGCGAGVGTRELLRAGAADVIGVEVRPEALELARASDPRGRWDAYLEHDLNHTPLPFDDASFDLIVALEVLEHVEQQPALIAEIRRLLAPDGLALISVPNKSFEDFWTGLAGEDNPYHVHVPTPEEFVELLGDFGWVELYGQIDVVSSLVLPLDGREADVADANLKVQAGTSISDRGTLAILAACRHERTAEAPLRTPSAWAYGNYQDNFGGAVAMNAMLAETNERMRHEQFSAANRAKWAEPGDDAGADG